MAVTTKIIDPILQNFEPAHACNLGLSRLQLPFLHSRGGPKGWSRAGNCNMDITQCCSTDRLAERSWGFKKSSCAWYPAERQPLIQLSADVKRISASESVQLQQRPSSRNDWVESTLRWISSSCEIQERSVHLQVSMQSNRICQTPWQRGLHDLSATSSLSYILSATSSLSYILLW